MTYRAPLSMAPVHRVSCPRCGAVRGAPCLLDGTDGIFSRAVAHAERFRQARKPKFEVYKRGDTTLDRRKWVLLRDGLLVGLYLDWRSAMYWATGQEPYQN